MLQKHMLAHVSRWACKNDEPDKYFTVGRSSAGIFDMTTKLSIIIVKKLSNHLNNSNNPIYR